MFSDEGLDLPNKGYDIQSRRVVEVAEEIHQSVYHGSSDFREANSAYMDRLDE